MADERRLIDLNELGIGRCNPDAFPLNNRGYCAGWNGVISLLEKAPTVNAVEVCFCKDCKNNPRFPETSGKNMVWCRKWRCETKETDFCSYGEKREVE